MYLYKNSLNDGEKRETERKLILVGASAYSLKIDFEALAEDVGALLRLLWPTKGGCLPLACIPTRARSGHRQQHDSKELVGPESRHHCDAAKTRKGQSSR